MFLTAILSSGKRADMEMAILLLEEDNKKVRTQLHTMLLKDMPYECGDTDVVALIDLGPDHDGPLRFITNPNPQ
jgi:hypothetical protein